MNTSFALDYMALESRLRESNSHADSPRPEARIIYKMLNQQLLLENKVCGRPPHTIWID